MASSFPVATGVERSFGVAFHGIGGEADDEAALNAGCDGYLTKPIDTRTFIATVKKIIAGANSRRTNTTSEIYAK
jgi:DNA-binding response OmpR family regulator